MAINLKKLRALKSKVIPFKWVEFSLKQKKVMTWWMPNSPYRDYRGIVCDGAVRSGKTVSEIFSFVTWAMASYNGYNFGTCGKTIQAHRRNVIKPLKMMLLARGYDVLDVKDENMLIIQKKYKHKGEIFHSINYFYIFGGRDEGSQDLIQGITLAGVFFDEVALMPESFVNQAIARCSVTGAKYWFSCNPDSPFHWFKQEWIDKAQEKKLLYLHFTMDDNPSLSDETRERYRNLFKGIFYKRFILGLWVIADGVVYPMFDMDKNVKDIHKPWTRKILAIDFGIQNATTFGMYGYYAPEQRYHLIDYYYHSGRDSVKAMVSAKAGQSVDHENVGQKTVPEYVDDLIKFIKNQGTHPDYIVIDPSASSLIIEIRKRSFFKRHGIKVINARNSVMEGVQTVSYLLQSEKFTIASHCEEDKKEFATYMWDDKKGEKGIEEPIKANDHCMDRNRYAIYTDVVLYKTLGHNYQQLVVGKGAIKY